MDDLRGPWRNLVSTIMAMTAHDGKTSKDRSIHQGREQFSAPGLRSILNPVNSPYIRNVLWRTYKQQLKIRVIFVNAALQA